MSPLKRILWGVLIAVAVVVFVILGAIGLAVDPLATDHHRERNAPCNCILDDDQ